MRARIAPAPSTTRVQRYGAYLALRVPTPDGVSTGVKQALRITRSLGGYAGSVHAAAAGTSGSADLTLKVPRTHVQEAIARLSALGTITAEQVDVQDLQAGLDATDRTIARLQRRLAALRAQPQSAANDARSRSARPRRSRACSAPRRPRSGRPATPRSACTSAPPLPKPAPGTTTARCTASASCSAGSGSAPSTCSRSERRCCSSSWLVWLVARTIRRRREDALLSRS